jgi:hypothetical protein
VGVKLGQLPIKSELQVLMSRETFGFVLELAAKKRGALIKRKRLVQFPMREDLVWQQHTINHMNDTV